MTAHEWTVAGLFAVVVILLLASGISAWRYGRDALDADYWHAAYQEALKQQVEAAENAREATELLVDRQDRVVELQARIVEQRVEITGLLTTIKLLYKRLGIIATDADWASTAVVARAAAVDADATQVLAAIDPGVTDTTGLDVHGGCRRDHEKGLHQRECVHCRPKMHPVVGHVG